MHDFICLSLCESESTWSMRVCLLVRVCVNISIFCDLEWVYDIKFCDIWCVCGPESERRHCRLSLWVNVWLICVSLCLCLYVRLLGCKCICAITHSVLQRLSGCSLSSCLIVYAAHWLFCRVECSERPEREAHVTAIEDCPDDWCMLEHTHTQTTTSHCTPPTHTEMYVHSHTHLTRGSVTVPQRGCRVRFYCLYWSWLRSSRGINTWIIWGS